LHGPPARRGEHGENVAATGGVEGAVVVVVFGSVVVVGGTVVVVVGGIVVVVVVGKIKAPACTVLEPAPATRTPTDSPAAITHARVARRSGRSRRRGLFMQIPTS
jgi:hypothetical protein